MENILKTLMKERGAYRLSGTDANKLTRECLQKALISLMKEKPFEGISVTELVRRSGVSRQSFYRNYTSKEEILSDMWKSLCRKITETVSGWKYKADTRQWYYDLFVFLKENGSAIELLIQANLHIREGMPALYNLFPSEAAEERYHLIAYEGALKGVIREWFQRGMREEISYMAELCNGMFGAYHSRLLEMLPTRG